MFDKDEIDPRQLIADIGNAEDRARTAREWGLVDKYSWHTPLICAGDGEQASINACIMGFGASQHHARRK